jgi:ATP-binding cassette subfamily B protein
MLKKTRNKKKINSIDNLIYFLKLVFKATPDRIVFIVLKRIIENIFYVLFFVYMIQYIFESIEKGYSFMKVCIFIAFFCVFHILMHTLSATADYYVSRNNPKLSGYIYGKVINKAVNMPLYKFESPKYYDEYARALEEAEDRAKTLVEDLGNAFGNFTAIICILILILKWDPVILLFPIIPIINGFMVNKLRSGIILDQKNEINRERRRLEYSKRVFYEKRYASEVRLYPIKKIFFDLQKNSSRNISKITSNYGKKLVMIDIYDNLIIRVFLLMICGIYATYKILVCHSLSIGIYVSMVTAILNMSNSLTSFLDKVTKLINHGKLIDGLRSFLESEEDEESNEGKFEIDEKFEKLTLENVSYKYIGSKSMSIKDVNITINKGEKIALVGLNGSGKTTLVKLIMGLYEVSSGRIYYNSTNRKEFKKKSYRDIFTAIFQDFQIYALSIAENVLMKQSITKEDEEKVLAALRKVGLQEKVTKMKKGIHTSLTREFYDDGEILSGGEAQKIAIARTFADDLAEIVILDEPSSALDPIAEYNMYQNLMKAANDRTVIFISHRLSSARMADRIYMLEDGQVVEVGTHDELMQLDGKYKLLFHMQARSYIDNDILEGVMQ